MYKAEKTISWFSRNISKRVGAGLYRAVSYKVKEHSIRSALYFGAERVPFFYNIHSSRLLRCDYRKASSSLLPKKAPQELFLYGRLRIPLSNQKALHSECFLIWRRERDSNPRYGVPVHMISNHAPSASRTSLHNDLEYYIGKPKKNQVLFKNI